MVAETTMDQTPSLGKWLPAVALAWIIPGGGHFLLKRCSIVYGRFDIFSHEPVDSHRQKRADI